MSYASWLAKLGNTMLNWRRAVDLSLSHPVQVSSTLSLSCDLIHFFLRCPGIGFSSTADREIRVVQHGAPATGLVSNFLARQPHLLESLLWCSQTIDKIFLIFVQNVLYSLNRKQEHKWSLFFLYLDSVLFSIYSKV